MSDRKHLPFRRRGSTMKIRHGATRSSYHVTCGYYTGGQLGEIFISTNSTGSAIEAMARDLAILMSLGLQHGCTIETMRDALTREADGAPSTIAGAVADALTGAR